MSVLITPRMSEKSFVASKNGTYIFTIPLDANKQMVARVISERYNVTVTNVTTTVVKGKAVRTHRGKGKFVNAVRRDAKKAYVRLKAGDTITIFEEAA